MNIDITAIFHKIVDWLVRFFTELKTAPQIIWDWSEKSTQYRVIVLLAAAAAAAMLIAVFVSTISTLVKKKQLSLFGLLFVSILICVVMWVARGQIIVRTVPEAEPVRINGEDVLATEQYSLARGISESEPTYYVMPSWFLVDDTLNFKVDDDTIIQLTGLHSLLEDRQYQWNQAERFSDFTRLGAVYWSSYGTGDVIRERLYVLVYPNVQLAEEKWYREAGVVTEVQTSHFGDYFVNEDGIRGSIDESVKFEILENSGDRVVGLAKCSRYEGDTAYLAQQMGEDLVLVLCNAYHRHNDESGSTHEYSFEPSKDPQELEYMLEPLTALLDGKLCLLHGLSEKQMSQLLPDRIVDKPIGFSLRTSRLCIPCSEIIEMGTETSHWNKYYGEQAIRFLGPGPDGREYVYFMFNESDSPQHDLSAKLRKEAPAADTEMSDFLGVKAVPYRDGWLLSMGKVDSNGNSKQYYYLTMEPVEENG